MIFIQPPSTEIGDHSLSGDYDYTSKSPAIVGNTSEVIDHSRTVSGGNIANFGSHSLLTRYGHFDYRSGMTELYVQFRGTAYTSIHGSGSE